MINIRSASYDDADQACLVLHRSIKELCFLDHGNDKTTIDEWLSNKTPENLISWIDNPDVETFIAETENAIGAVGLCTLQGEILLNYVHPDFRFQGMSKALLTTMEKALKDNGVIVAGLTSTRTAERFYQSNGWEPADETKPRENAVGVSMTKLLK